MLIGVAITIIVIQPYRDIFKMYNKLDAAMMLLLAAFYSGIVNVNNNLVRHQQYWLMFTITLSLVPLVYISIIILRHLLPYQHIIRGFRRLRRLA